MANPIYFKRGLKANLPTLNVAEPAFTTDTKQLFVGSGSGNVEMAKRSDITFETAGGTGTAITLTLAPLINGYAKTFIAYANNSGAATTINGTYPLYKPGTTTAPTLIAGRAYSVWYNSSSNAFFCKANSEGTALASHVLASKTFSNDTDTGLNGSIVERSSYTTSISVGTDNVSTFFTRVPQGAYLTNSPVGSPEISTPYADVASAIGLTANKIGSGNTILGIAGTLSSGGFVTGTDYTSVAAAMSPHNITVNVGFQPSAVVIYDSYDNSYSTAYTNTVVNNFLCPGASINIKGAVYLQSLSITATGFTGSDAWNRPGGDVIHWICFK